MTDKDFKNIEDIKRILKYIKNGKLDVKSWDNICLLYTSDAADE